MDKKATNPKDALGIKKAPLHLVPTGPLYEVGLAMLEGGRKYGAHNYRAVGTRASVYYDAALRHINQWWEGEDIDAASGVHHLMKAAACLFVQRDSQMMGNDVDDRPIRYTGGLCMDKLNEAASKLVESHKECAKPFTEKTKIGKLEPKALRAFNKSLKLGSTYGIGKTGFTLGAAMYSSLLSAKLCRFADDLPSGEHMIEFCACCKCGVRLIGSNTDESYGGFRIRRPVDECKGWYVLRTNCLAGEFLHKDLKTHSGTGHHPWKHGPGEAPGYYMTKQEARKAIDAFNNKPIFEVRELKFSRVHRIYDWWIHNLTDNTVLHSDLQLRRTSVPVTTSYYPTKQIAQAYLDAYLEQEKQQCGS